MIVPIGDRGVLFPGRQWRTLAPDHSAAGSRAHDDEVCALTPSPHEQGCARGGRHSARPAWAGPGRLSGEARPPAAALPCRRRGGLCCPARECADGGRARPTVCDREQGGRGRDHRDRRDRQGDTRRLYPSAHDTQSHHQCRAQSETALRYRKGPCADLNLGRSPGTACEPPGGAVRLVCRLCRIRAKESRQAQLRVRRQRNASACHHGTAVAAERDRCRPHPVSRSGAGHDRSAGWPGAAQDGHLRHRQPARGRWQAACACLCETRALGIDAERADGGRDGACRIRGHPVDRPACDRGATRDPCARSGRAPQARRRRPRWQHARSIWRADHQGNQGVRDLAQSSKITLD